MTTYVYRSLYVAPFIYMMNFYLLIYLTIICALLPHNFHPFVRICTTAVTLNCSTKKWLISRERKGIHIDDELYT